MTREENATKEVEVQQGLNEVVMNKVHKMVENKTIDLYRELQEEKSKQDCYRYDCFFAFSNQQFAEGLKKIRPLKEGEKLVSVGAGMYGTRDGVDKFFAAYDEIDKRIKQECDPQEVYFYEYNNHESMVSWDGDMNAIRIIIKYWGEEVARKIVRKRAFYTIDEILNNAIY